MLNNKAINNLESLVENLLKFKQPTDKLLSDFFKENRNLDSKTKQIVANTIYAIVRNFYTIQNSIDKLNILNIIGFVWLNYLNLDISTYNLKKIDYTHIAKFPIRKNFEKTL